MIRWRPVSLLGMILSTITGLPSQPTWAADEPRASTTREVAGSSASGAMVGFAPGRRGSQRDAEARALLVPSPENARRWLNTVTAEPHVAGTPADYRTAVFVRDRLREWGWTADLVPYEVLLNYPRGTPRLSLIKPVHRDLEIQEAPIASDKDSASSDAFGPFHGYGISGEAKGQVVYANYGRVEDFEAIEKQGISISGKIVLARYGGNFRGLKVLNAQKRGAVGVLIFSDPGDDGYAKGDVYPDGPNRPPSAIQRGSVQFLSLGPGDPSTPHGPSKKGAARLTHDPRDGFPLKDGVPRWESDSGFKRDSYFATIPSLPLSYRTARQILEVMAGPNVPSDWQGGLPLPYHMGPGPVEISFSIEMDYQIRTIWNVIATLPGTEEPDHWIMVGNHRDAWVYGAVDPGSGTAATLETCRAIGGAVKAGWKPRRTLVYASWDAEEYGLVGSTEWAEDHAAEVDCKALLMLNVDSAVSGPNLSMSGVPSLRDLALEAASAVEDVRTGKSLSSVWNEARFKEWSAATPLHLADPVWDGSTGGKPRGFFPQLGPLGSGSDYTAFLDHLGVPCLDMGLGGPYGVYHSIYDNFRWMSKFGDPEFLNHVQAARLYTVLLMRAAAADVVHFRFVPYAEAMRDHVDALRLQHARAVRGKSGPGQTTTAGADHFDGLSNLVGSIVKFRAVATELDRSLDRLSERDGVTPEKFRSVNAALLRIERAFLLDEGLPGRKWFRHGIYAPGLTTGYGAWPLPAIRQSFEEKKPGELTVRSSMTVARIDAASQAIRDALTVANGAMK